jgi:hypothetical protein
MTQKQLKTARKHLERLGYEFIMFMMRHDNTNRYGLVYCNGEREFYLNDKTVDYLP